MICHCNVSINTHNGNQQSFLIGSDDKGYIMNDGVSSYTCRHDDTTSVQSSTEVPCNVPQKFHIEVLYRVDTELDILV